MGNNGTTGTNGTTYDTPATFVNTKRVRQGKDSKDREQIVLTFGLTKDKNGNEVNTADQLITALEQYRGKQVNLDVRLEEKTTPQGRKFPSAFVRIVEMVPKDQQTQFVPKTTSKTDAIKARAEQIRKDVGG